MFEGRTTTHLHVASIVWAWSPTLMYTVRSPMGRVVKRRCQRLGHDLLGLDLVGYVSLRKRETLARG